MLETTFTILLGIQFFHSIEELSTKFHERFPLFKMKWQTFLLFEIIFLSFFLSVLLFENLANRDVWMAIFTILMFANGLWHIVWWGIEKKYVPGLCTAPLFIITFLIFYFKTLF